MPVSTTMSRVIARADELKFTSKISARQLAALVGLSPAVLSNMMSGVTYLGTAQKEAELAQVTILLQSMQLAIHPLRLPDKIDQLQKLVDHVRASDIEVEDVYAIRHAVIEFIGE